MARITVEDCLTQETNRFGLVQLAAKRTKQILGGSKPLLDEVRNNKAVVTALREIAGGHVRFMTEEEERVSREQEAEAVLREEESIQMPTTVRIAPAPRAVINVPGLEDIKAVADDEEYDAADDEDDDADDLDDDAGDDEGDDDEGEDKPKKKSDDEPAEEEVGASRNGDTPDHE